jgi:hypothetical protein
MDGVNWASRGALVRANGCGECVSTYPAESGKSLPRAKVLAPLLAAGLLVLTPASQAFAAESAFSSYALGTSAFTAGLTPPPGTYLSAGLGYITGDFNGALTFGGVEIDVAMEIRKFVNPLASLLYVPEKTVLGGRPGFSLTVPAGFVDLAAQATVPWATLSSLQPRAGIGRHHSPVSARVR